ncbi:MAG TPA: hypothetical protein VG733_14875 [Chthoniobacteraceae bacterium]|nr:hypothetical protein [Chthoniobacteraceae bacterium]
MAIRYLQAEGVSHSQLYLFREDGKLLRQYTHEKSGQVMDPVFAPDGSVIVFRVERGKTTEYWSVEPKGEGLHKLDLPPSWYSAAQSTPYFTNDFDNRARVAAKPSPSPAAAGKDVSDQPKHYITPDSKQEIILIEDEDTDDNPQGTHFQLKDLKAGSAIELGKVPGFSRISDMLHLSTNASTTFLMEGDLRLAFFWVHLDSTDGDTVYALDLANPRFVQLSQNWASPFPLSGEEAFLTLTETRYLPISGSKKTANCSYIERWDSALKKVRYGTEAAAICYGASMYRPKMKPAVITVPAMDYPG